MVRKYLQCGISRETELINKRGVHISVHFGQNNLGIKKNVYPSSFPQQTHTYIGLFCKYIGHLLESRSKLLAVTTPRSEKLDHHGFTLLEDNIVECLRCKSNDMGERFAQTNFSGYV